MATHSSILPGKSHRQRSQEGYSPWGFKESDTTQQLNNNNNNKPKKLTFESLSAQTDECLRTEWAPGAAGCMGTRCPSSIPGAQPFFLSIPDQDANQCLRPPFLNQKQPFYLHSLIHRSLSNGTNKGSCILFSKSIFSPAISQMFLHRERTALPF